MKRFCCWLILICVFYCSETQDLSSLSGTVQQDIFNIYNKIPVTVNALLNHVATADSIQYYYFNSSNPSTYTQIGPNNASIVSQTAPIAVFIHGWLQDRTNPFYEQLKTALFKNNSAFVVIEVDWSTYSKEDYYNAQNDVQYVGPLIGEFLVALVQQYSIPLKNFLVIGFSLGGQAAGFVGKTVFKELNTNLSRIVALEPAGPLYALYPSTQKLCPTDADVVHVVHTNAGGFGYPSDCGTIDFWPNGGSLQPGCVAYILTNLAQLNTTVFCEHTRSWNYFVEAVNTPAITFLSQDCPNYVAYETKTPLLSLCSNDYEQLGSLTTTKTGDYFCNTKSTSPYSE